MVSNCPLRQSYYDIGGNGAFFAEITRDRVFRTYSMWARWVETVARSYCLFDLTAHRQTYLYVQPNSCMLSDVL